MVRISQPSNEKNTANDNSLPSLQDTLDRHTRTRSSTSAHTNPRSLSHYQELHDTSPKNAGAEPGIDPRHHTAKTRYGHIWEECKIAVIDYSPESCNMDIMDNARFIELMNGHCHTPTPSKASESPGPIRWINIGGISWDVISALALAYDLHSLAIEDILIPQDQNNSKADYFQHHLFLRVLCHVLSDSSDEQYTADETPRAHAHTKLKERALPSPVTSRNLKDSASSERESGLKSRKLWHSKQPNGSHQWAFTPRIMKSFVPRIRVPKHMRAATRKRRQLAILELKGDSIKVHHMPMFIFLMHGGETIITVQPTTDLDFSMPIYERLREQGSGLRTSSDGSLLVHSLIDLCVDRVLEIVEEYQDQLYELEQDILLKPNMNIIRSLHIVSGDLNRHIRTLTPIKTLIDGLRRYDGERTLASSPGYNAMLKQTTQSASSSIAPSPNMVPNQPEGYMSYRTKIYLGDVYDHIDFAIQSLETFSSTSENLIDFAFNMASYEMNETMRRLTLATIIFLPLTLLTGYFGMNFTAMWSINNNTDVLFWIIALPVMGVLIPIFTYPDIKKMLHYIQRKVSVTRTPDKE